MIKSEKPRIIFDLDETLLYSISKDELKGLSKGEKAILKTFKTVDMKGSYTVLERPGLQKFLDFAFANFKVSIWTAASKDYASFIVSEVILKDQGKKKPKRKIEWLFYSDHCKFSEKETKNIKDLTMLWDFYEIQGFDKKNTFIMDDHPLVHKAQPFNCIYMDQFDESIFKKDSPPDDFLYRLQPHLKKLASSIKKQQGVDTQKINNQMKKK